MSSATERFFGKSSRSRRASRSLGRRRELRAHRNPARRDRFGADPARDHRCAHRFGRHDVAVYVLVHPETVDREIRDDADDRRRIGVRALVLGHRAAGESVRADDDVRAFAQDERAQVAGGELMGPGAEGTHLGRALGAVVDVAVHLRDGLHHPQVPIGDDPRNDQRRVLVGIHHERACARIHPPQSVADGVGCRDVPDADARREKEDANLTARSHCGLLRPSRQKRRSRRGSPRRGPDRPATCPRDR